MSENGHCADDTEQSLEERIREKLMVEDPDEDSLVDALEDVIQIVDGRWSIRFKDDINQRDPTYQVFTYLLGKYAAARVSDGEVSMSATREELYEHFDRKLVKEVCEHGWIRHWDGQVQIRPRHYKHTVDELAARYANRPVDTDTDRSEGGDGR
jgi:predicted house-cleaning noncanonical NTP pyrophosphatase (MazG superfamily)